MYEPLVPCPSCNRHVRAIERSCPFCSENLPSNLTANAVPSATQRLSRAAAFLFGASLTLTGCGGDISTGSGSSGGSSGQAGGTSGASSGGMTDGGPNDDGGVVAEYGAPAPVDAGPDDDGGGGAKYGAPPPPDAGDDGGIQPLYGAAPPDASAPPA
jgi:hypothetical protein